MRFSPQYLVPRILVSASFGAVLSASLFAPPLVAQVAGLTGTVIITNKTPATATIVDVGSGRTLVTLPTGNGPHEVVVSSDGRTAVVTDYGTGPAPGSTLTVIDVPGLRVARTISVAPHQRPHGIVFLPGDSIVVVTSEAARLVMLVNVRSGDIVRTASTNQNGSHMVGVAADGITAWTGNIGSNTITELDLSTGKAIRNIDVPAQPEAINVTADGSEVWVGSNATGKVSVVDAYTGAVSTAADSVSWPYRVLYSPDAKLAFIPDYRGNALRVLDRKSRKELGRMAFPGGGPQGISITPDGKYVLLSMSSEARIAIIDVASRRVVGHLAAGETPDGVVYTPLQVVAPGQ